MSSPTYDRQPQESAKAFEAFRMYREMGASRSIAKVAEILHKSMALLNRWSGRWNWVERVREYDIDQERLAREAQAHEIAEMRRRHIQIASLVQAKGLESMSAIVPGQLKPAVALTFVEKAMHMERIARGEPTEIVEQRTQDQQEPGNIWNAIKRDDVREMLAKLGRRSAPPLTDIPDAEPTVIVNGVAHKNGTAASGTDDAGHAEPSLDGLNGVAHKNGKPPGTNGDLPHP